MKTKMKTLYEIYLFLDSISPFELQEEWDNSGLIIGNGDKEIESLSVCLEITKQIALDCREDSLIISHHPIIFKGLRSLDFKDYPSNIIEILIKKNISVIAMHTNFDLTHLNEYFVKNILGFNEFKKDGIACIVKQNKSFKDFVNFIATRLENTTLKFSQANDKVNNIAIVCGSGISEVERFKKDIDCIITGDIKYHDAMKFKSIGISTIDVGHYNSECFFGEVLAPYLKKINYKAIILDSQNPFGFKENML